MCKGNSDMSYTKLAPLNKPICDPNRRILAQQDSIILTTPCKFSTWRFFVLNRFESSVCLPDTIYLWRVVYSVSGVEVNKSNFVNCRSRDRDISMRLSLVTSTASLGIVRYYVAILGGEIRMKNVYEQRSRLCSMYCIYESPILTGSL